MLSCKTVTFIIITVVILNIVLYSTYILCPDFQSKLENDSFLEKEAIFLLLARHRKSRISELAGDIVWVTHLGGCLYQQTAIY